MNSDDVYKVIAKRIETGKLKPGDRLPPISKISKEIGVPYACIRTAYGELAERKLVQASTSGHVVSAPAKDPVPVKPRGAASNPVTGTDVLNQVFLTVTEIAGTMRVSKMTVLRLIHSGELESLRVGRSFRVPEASFLAYMRGANTLPEQNGEPVDG